MTQDLPHDHLPPVCNWRPIRASRSICRIRTERPRRTIGTSPDAIMRRTVRSLTAKASATSATDNSAPWILELEGPDIDCPLSTGTTRIGQTGESRCGYTFIYQVAFGPSIRQKIYPLKHKASALAAALDDRSMTGQSDSFRRQLAQPHHACRMLH